jgi:hypothetical protein
MSDITPLDQAILDRAAANDGRIGLYGVDQRTVANRPWSEPQIFTIRGGNIKARPELSPGAARRAANRPWRVPAA